MTNLTGHSLKGYELLERIGSGGFGAVYRAYQSTIGREVAVKVILPHFANQPDFIRRFEAEAQIVARLEHLHIVPLYDYWREPNGAYLVMRWLRGGSLKDALRDGPFDLEPASYLLNQVAAALAVAHTAEVVHRDLKPANILLDEEGNAYLADFGIALDLRRRGGDGEDEDSEVVAGSPAYLSPEQIRGEKATLQTDIYSLGITLYELLSGAHPFPDLNTVELLYKQINDPLPPLTMVADEVRDEVNAVIQRATAKDPRQRYNDALSLAAAFRKAVRLQERDAEELIDLLTRREQEVLDLIIAGLTNRQIAQELTIEYSTVKWYIRQIYNKLGVRGRRQAIARVKEMEATMSPLSEATIETTRYDISLPPLNPYQGLRPFAAADQDNFFGREALVARLLERLKLPDGQQSSETSSGAGRFLAVVGPSGSGKSSLVHAGLIPALWNGGLPGSDRWFVVDFTPSARPLDELEVALIRVAADQAGNLRQQLERDANGLLRAAGLILPQDDSELVLVIDQFEELFSLVPEERERVNFLQLLTMAVTAPHSRIRVILTLRADYYDRPLHYPDFGQLVRRHMETVLPLKAGELEQAIVRPANMTGVTYEPGLVAAIIDDVLYQPGALPLLQYALTELFAARDGRFLTHAAYQAIGGATGALARRAEELYREQDSSGRELLRQLFLRLVFVGEGDEADPDTRRRVPQSELMALGNDEDLIEELIDIFAAYRLLTLDHDPASRRPTVEIAHEALLREWERLRGWLADSRDDLYQHRRLQILTAEWLGAGRVDGLLLRQARLDQFAAWADATDLALSEAERDYLEASVAARQARQSDEAERQQRELETAQKLAETEGQRAEAQGQANRRLRLLAVGLAIILLVAIAASLFAKEQSRRAEQQARLATARELVRASAANLEVDSERGILLALEAINTTRNVDGIVLPEAEEILHSAVQSHRLRLAINDEGQSKEFLTFDPSGNRIVTWGNYPDALGTMQVWDAHSGEPLSSFPGFYAGVHWSKADQLASITIAPDGLVQHNWDPGSGEELSTVPFSPVGEVINGNQNWDSTLAAIVLADGRIEIRDAATANLLTLLGPPEESSNGIVRFSRNGEYLVGGHFGGLVRVWDLTNGELLFKFPGHAGDVSDIEFSPDDTFFVTGSGDATAKIWDTNSGELLAILVGHTNDISSVAINSAGNLVATAGWDRQIKIWNLQASLATGAGKELLTLHGHPAAIRWVEFNPDGTELASVGLDGSIRFWDLGYGAGSEGPVFVNGPEMPTVLTAVIELTADGKRLIATNFNETPKIWDIENEELLFTLEGHEGSVQFLDLSSDQSLIATSGSDHTVRIWDATTGRNLLTIGDAGCDRCKVVFGPEGKRLAVATELGASILILDLQAMLSSEALNTSEILSADSFELFEIPVNPELNYWYSVVEFNLDGTQIVTGAPGNKVAFWDTNTGEMVNTLSGHEAPVSDIVYSPDGSLIVTSGIDGTARIWDAASGEPLHTLSGHNSSVWSPQFSPDMSTLATASSDGTVKLWDLATGELKLTLYGHTSLVTDLAFSPDGLRLYTASNDGTSRTYLLDLDDLIALAESRVTRSLTDDECREFLHMAACSPDR